MPPERTAAFAPGRVNLIGEHTDYNGGLALPFAITQGITVRAQASGGGEIHARAVDLGEEDRFALADPGRASGWRAFVRGTVAELRRAGLGPPGALLELGGDLPRGAGLSSSAALEVALCLALLALREDAAQAPARQPERERAQGLAPHGLPRHEIARLCSRVENEWVGARTGLLDQLASLYGRPDTALCIDFRTLAIEPVPLRLEGWQVVVLDSGERPRHAASGYNQRRAECARACELLGVGCLSAADERALARLPEPLRARAAHVLGENARVREAVGLLQAGELGRLGPLLNASHASLRDRYEVSTPAVERAVRALLDAGAAGARVVGGGFGGSVLGLFAPGARPPAGALQVHPGAGAHLLEEP